MPDPHQIIPQQILTELLECEPALVAAMDSLAPLLSDPSAFCEQNPLGGLALLCARGRRYPTVELSEPALQGLCRLGAASAVMASAATALAPSTVERVAESIADWSGCPLLLVPSATARSLAERPYPAGDGIPALRSLWWRAMAGDPIAPSSIPSQGSEGALLPLILTRLLFTLAEGGTDANASAGALARYAAARTTAPHVQRRLEAWAGIFSGGGSPDDAFTNAFIRFMALQQQAEVIELLTDEASSTADPLIRCALFYSTALLQLQHWVRRGRPADQMRASLALPLLEMRQAAMECGHAATAAATFSVHAFLGIAGSGGQVEPEELVALAPAHPLVAILDPDPQSSRRRALIARLAPLFERNEHTPALLEQHSIIERVEDWARAVTTHDRASAARALSALPDELARPLRRWDGAAAPEIAAEPTAAAAPLIGVSDEKRLRAQLAVELVHSSPMQAEPAAIIAAATTARALLEEAPRDRIALCVLGRFAEITEDVESAIHYWERAARVTLDARTRAAVYVRIATILSEQLGNANGALENAIVAFICAPDSADALALLETRYRATARYKDLHSVYGDAAQASLENHDTQRASDLLARRAQLEFQVLSRPEAAAQTLVEAIGLADDPSGLLTLLRTHIAPVAGDIWVARAEATLSKAR